jgi:hypothetical protein
MIFCSLVPEQPEGNAWDEIWKTIGIAKLRPGFYDDPAFIEAEERHGFRYLPKNRGHPPRPTP